MNLLHRFHFVFLLMNKHLQEKIGDEAESQMVLVQDEGFETNLVGSEDMELNISLVLEKIENFTQRVSISYEAQTSETRHRHSTPVIF